MIKKFYKKIYWLMVGYPPCRVYYWSSSKLATFIKKKVGFELSSTNVESLKRWKEIDATNKKNHPIVYWVVEVFFDRIQNVVNFPRDVYRNIKNKYHNYFVTKTHYIKTGLPKGEWHEIDTRLLHGMFTLLVEYVEEDCAKTWYMFLSEGDTIKKNKREAGIAYIDYQIESCNLEESKELVEVKKLYTWWKDVRLTRETIWDIHKEIKPENVDDTDWDMTNLVQNLDSSEVIKESSRSYWDEDKDMMHRMINILSTLWI